MKNRKLFIRITCIILAVILLIALIVPALQSMAYADELSDLQAEKANLAAQAASCQERLRQLQEQQANVLEQKAALNEQNEIAKEQLLVLEAEIASYDRLIEEKAKEVDKARNKEKNQLEKYRARVRAMEENGNTNIISLVTNSETFIDFLTALDDMGEIMKSDRLLQEQYVAAREETEAAKARFEAEKAEYVKKQEELKAEQQVIAQKIVETNNQLDSLEKDIEKALEEYKAAEAAEDAAADAIAAMIANLAAQQAAEANQAKQMQAANQAAEAAGESLPYTEEQIQQAEEQYTASSVSPSGLMWPVPCSSRISSYYGYRSDPFTGESKYHSGIDIDGFGNDGAPVVAAADGTVITASSDSGYGNYVIIQHGNMQTLYAHMSGFAVSVGSSVSQGQTIGYLGATGRATGTHLHFEVFVDGARVDPTAYV